MNNVRNTGIVDRCLLIRQSLGRVEAIEGLLGLVPAQTDHDFVQGSAAVLAQIHLLSLYQIDRHEPQLLVLTVVEADETEKLFYPTEND